MRDFSKVSPAVWESERFVGLPDSDAKLVYLYLLSCRHANSVGCFRLPPGYAADDLRWEETRFCAALTHLKANELAEYNQDTKEVMIPRWLRHNPPTNSKHYLGARRNVANIKSDEFRATVERELEAAWKARQPSGAHSPPAPVQPSGAVSTALLDRIGSSGPR